MLVIFPKPGVGLSEIQVHDPSLSSRPGDNKNIYFICDPTHRPMFLFFFLAIFDMHILFLTWFWCENYAKHLSQVWLDNEWHVFEQEQ